MSLETISTLIGAATESADRLIRLAYLGEARIALSREQTRLNELRLLLDALEAEVVRTTPIHG